MAKQMTQLLVESSALFKDTLYVTTEDGVTESVCKKTFELMYGVKLSRGYRWKPRTLSVTIEVTDNRLATKTELYG